MFYTKEQKDKGDYQDHPCIVVAVLLDINAYQGISGENCFQVKERERVLGKTEQRGKRVCVCVFATLLKRGRSL